MNKKKRLVFATNNPHKLEEARAILGGEVEIVSLSEIGCHDDIPETADTLEGNALIKARWVRDRYGADCFADDTGLMVDALGGAPGVYSARWAGPGCTPDDNIDKLLAEMAGEESRSAHFSTVVALAADGAEHTFEGRVGGTIARERLGEGGFGYDPVFIADETGLSFAQMDAGAKNAISHRGRAMTALARFLTGMVTALIALLLPAVAKSEEWRYHPTYDGQAVRVVDTPDYTYYLGTTQEYVPGNPKTGTLYGNLYRLDKEAGEAEWLSEQNLLSGTMVSAIAYNHAKRYLAIAYDDGNLDLLYDGGTVANIPGLMLADGSLSKKVNDINFDAPNDRLVMATGFGYVVVDDKKKEMELSRNFGRELNSALWFGGSLWIADATGLYRGDPTAFDFKSFERLGDVTKVRRLVPGGDKYMYLLYGNPWWQLVRRVYKKGNDFSLLYLSKSHETGIEPGRDGLLITSPDQLHWYDFEGKETKTALPADLAKCPAGSHDGREISFSAGRRGFLTAKVPTGDSGKWEINGTALFPNASNAFFCGSMAYHPEFGMLVRNHGWDRNFNNDLKNYFDTPDLLSAYRNLEWTPVSATYRTDMPGIAFDNPSGVAVDPRNTDHVYCGSARTGLLRLDLKHPEKSLHFSRRSDMLGGYGQTGFVEAVPDGIPAGGWETQCSFSPPVFDSEGNMWVVYVDPFDTDNTHLYYWTAEDRAAMTSAQTFRPFRKVRLDKAPVGNLAIVKTLSVGANRNILLIKGGKNTSPLIVWDHNGTPSQTGDDRRADLKVISNTDGKELIFNHVYSWHEDPATGLVWVGYDDGVFTFRPTDVLNGQVAVTNIKVPRNDGTNLADYLLDKVMVNAIESDSSGRKWFGTIGAGLVCTTSDGRTILKTYTTENSDLRGDVIYTIGINPDNNSIMVSTDRGLCELFTDGVSSGSTESVRIYPNPVRPGYYGHVTIDGLPMGAMVKIVDSAGHLVRECGRAQTGEMQWDLTNDARRRVPGGVYFVIAANGPGDDTFARVGKLLVVD